LVFAIATLCALSLQAYPAIPTPGSRVALYCVSPRDGLQWGPEIYPSLETLIKGTSDSARYAGTGDFPPGSTRGTPFPSLTQALTVQSMAVPIAGSMSVVTEVEFTTGPLRHRRAWVLGSSVHAETRQLFGE
jgi:hypothetical protein